MKKVIWELLVISKLMRSDVTLLGVGLLEESEFEKNKESCGVKWSCLYSIFDISKHFENMF